MVEEDDGGLFGSVVDSNWEVDRSRIRAPAPLLERGSTVHITLDRR